MSRATSGEATTLGEAELVATPLAVGSSSAHVAAAAVLGERVGRELIRLTPRGERRRHVGEERVLQNQLGIDDVVAGLGAAAAFA